MRPGRNVVRLSLAECWPVRIAARDGEMFMLTKDYRIDRVSVYIKADKIFAVDVG